MVAFQKRLFLAWAGPEPEGGRLHILSAKDGERFADGFVSDQIVKTEDVHLAFMGNHLFYGVKHHSTGAPTVVESNDDLLFKVGSGAIGGLQNERSSYSPAVCNWNEKLFIAWVGTDGRINVASYDGTSIRNKVTLEEQAHCGVALAAQANRLVVAYAGTDPGRHLNVMVSTDGQKFGGKVTLNKESSDLTPSVAWLNGKLYLAWAGSNNGKLNVISSGDLVTFSGKTTFEESTSHSPTIAAFNNKLWLAWKGEDIKSRPNVMSVSS